jgi:hypothetical protein
MNQRSPESLPPKLRQPEREVPEYEGLTAKQCLAVESLLSGQTMAAAAVVAGVNYRTLCRWVKDPRFRTVLAQARRDAFAQAVGLTARYAPVAVAALVKVMNDNAATPSARVAAAAVLLKFGREGIELDDLAGRVEALEQAAVFMASAPRRVKPTVAELPDLRLAAEE